MKRSHVLALVAALLFLTCAGLLFPAVQKVREAASRMQCHCHSKCLTTAMHNYAATYGDAFPPGTLLPHADLPPEQRLSWLVPLLPFIEQDRVYKLFDLTRGPGDSRNAKAARVRLGTFVCSSSGEHERGSGWITWDEAAGDWKHSDRAAKWKSPKPLTHYVGVAGVGADAAELPLKHPRAGAFGDDRRTSLKDGFPDGTSNTLLIIETAHEPGHWAYGGFATVRAFERGAPYIGPGRAFGGFHNGSLVLFGQREYLCVAALADGSVKQFTSATAPEVLEALATVGGKEELPPNW